MATFEFSPQVDHAGLVLAVLGGLRLVWGTSMVAVPRPSERLLAFLAPHGGAVNRAAVAGIRWPDVSEHRAYSNLGAALSRLSGTARRALATSKLELLSADVERTSDSISPSEDLTKAFRSRRPRIPRRV